MVLGPAKDGGYYLVGLSAETAKHLGKSNENWVIVLHFVKNPRIISRQIFYACSRLRIFFDFHLNRKMQTTQPFKKLIFVLQELMSTLLCYCSGTPLRGHPLSLYNGHLLNPKYNPHKV